jgi:DNA sulfur modification protein DndB
VINFKVDSSLQFDKKEDFGDTATGTLHLPGQYGSAWIIDGQHRLYGYAHSERKDTDKSVVTVLAYENLPVRDEIELFIDINTEQVKVSRNLVNEILSSLDIDDPDPRKRLDAAYARIALRLDTSPTSPLRNRVLSVSYEKTSERCITVTSLADGISDNSLLGTIHRMPKGQPPVLIAGPLTDITGDISASIEKTVITISQYLALFSAKLENHWNLGDAKGGYLCTNNGIRAILQLFRRVLQFVEKKDTLVPRVMEREDIKSRLSGSPLRGSLQQISRQAA